MFKIPLKKGTVVKINGFPCALAKDTEVETATQPEIVMVNTVGTAGGNARAHKLSPKKRSEIAQTAAKARWKK